MWDIDDPRVLALNTYSIPPSPVQHLGAWIKVDLKEMRAGGEWGFITLIVMPTAHNEVHYRADVVRLEWLKRHEQPCRSGWGKRICEGESKWLGIGGTGAETEWIKIQNDKGTKKDKNMWMWDAALKGCGAKSEKQTGRTIKPAEVIPASLSVCKDSQLLKRWQPLTAILLCFTLASIPTWLE